MCYCFVSPNWNQLAANESRPINAEECVFCFTNASNFTFLLYNKKKQLEQDAKIRGIPAPKVLRSETDKLNLKAKRMADNYAKLIFTYRSIGFSE